MARSKTKYMVWMAVASTLAVSGSGCKKKSDDGPTLTIPQVAPLVNSSLPAGLKSGATSALSIKELKARASLDQADVHTMTVTPDNTNANLASGYIINLFQDSFASSKGSTQGFIIAQVTTVDDRMSLFQSATIQDGSCLKNTPKPFTIDLSAIDPMLNFTLSNIQCYAAFNSSASTDAGEVFGQSGSDTSLWVQASDNVASTGTAGVIYANVKNAGSTSSAQPETVDGVSMIFNPNTSSGHGGTLTIARFIASPVTKTFELFIGSNGGLFNGMPGSHDTYLGPGFRMISDGNFIYADGRLCIVADITQCSTDASKWQSFNACLDPSTIAPVAASNCNSLANSFTLNNTSAAISFEKITGDNSGNLTHSCSTVGPSDSNATLVLPACKISTFKSDVSSW